MNGDGRRRAYVPEIDGVRAIAVSSVMLFHLIPSLLPGGFVGVDVFFVISGYVVSGSIARDAGRPLLGMLTHFYARRVVRILPALLACLLIGSLLTIMFVPPSWLGNGIWSTARAAFIGMSNVALRKTDTYFSPRAEFNTFTHTWSLGIEEQFYLLTPLLLFVWHRLHTRPGALGWAARLLIPASTILSFALLASQSQARGNAGFYSLSGRFWELAVGMVLFQAQADGGVPAVSSKIRVILLTAGVAVIAAACVVTDAAQFPYPWAVLPVAGALLALAAITSGPSLHGGVAALLRAPPITYVGRLSYSLYLWHWCVYVLLRWTWGLDRPAQQATAVALSVAMAAASYHLMERPAREAGWVRRMPKPAIMLAGVAAAFLSREALQHMVRAQDQLTLSVVRQHGPAWFPDAVVGVDGPGQCPVVIQNRFSGATQTIDMHRACTPPGTVRHRLFILGDSHALAYTRMASMVARATDVEVRFYSAAGCTVANMLGPVSPACASFIDHATADIGTRAEAGDAVFLASLRAVRISEQWGPTSPATIAARTEGPAAEADRRTATEDAIHLATALQRNGDVHVVIEAPKPVFAASPFRCVDWFNAANPACRGGLTVTRVAALRSRQPVMDGIAQLRLKVPAVMLWDPFDTICPGETCRAMTPDGPLFVDGDHLSALANQLLYPEFMTLLRSYWPDLP